MYEDFEVVDIYETEGCMLFVYPCGCVEEISFEDFDEMVFEGMIEIEDYDEEDYEIDFDDEFEEVDEELDYLVSDVAEEIESCLESGDYEGAEVLSRVYANLYELMFY